MREGVAKIERWWTDKYRLPANHPLFLDRSWDAWHQEMIEDWLARRDQLEHDLGDADVEQQKRIRAQIREIDQILGGDSPVDPLIEKWEQELAQGLIPDLSEAFD